uniref:Thiamine pyrimidine synthase n=1 Tax=Neobacillus citreus TaxID=2833578 RepID=A0A942Y8J6_9BACI
MTRPIRRRSILAATALAVATTVALTGCATSSSSASSDDGTTTMKLVLGWYADPESGGFYAGQTEGLYEKAGIDLSIQQGGPTVSGTQIVAGGRADIGMGDAAAVAEAQQQGIPIVAIGALYQTNPVGVMVHADSGMDSFDDMAGHTWVVQTGNVGVEYMQQEKGLDFDTQAYQGSIANFIKDDSLVQQGWPTNEVYQAQEQGVDTTFFSYASAGFNPYNDVIFTTKKYLQEHPDEVKAFLDASMNGWKQYMGDIDVAERANAQLEKVNSQQTSESVWFAWDKQREYVVDGDGAEQLGTMTTERWTTLVDQLVELGVLDERIPAKDLFDASYLPDVAAPIDLPAAPEGSY